MVYRLRQCLSESRMLVLDLTCKSLSVHSQCEKEAFLNAMKMAKKTAVEVKSIRLDRYYSGQYYFDLCQQYLKNVGTYLIPKKNATINGSWGWKNMLHKFVNDTKST